MTILNLRSECTWYGHMTFSLNFQILRKIVMASALRYDNKVTIITGGSKGIGQGCVRLFG